MMWIPDHVSTYALIKFNQKNEVSGKKLRAREMDPDREGLQLSTIARARVEHE